MAYYQPFNPLPAFNALKKVGPKSTYTGYDEMTQEDPNYPPWSAQRPEYAPYQGINTTMPGPSINTGDEADLSFLANRDPSSVIPGANEYWGNKLRGVQDTREQGRLAELSGFLSPQEAAGYGRQMEEEKMRQPLGIAREQIAGQLSVADKQAAAQMAQEQESTKRAFGTAEIQQQGNPGMNEYYGALANQLRNPNPNIRSANRSGVITAPNVQIPTNLISQLGLARTKGSAFQPQVDQIIANIMPYFSEEIRPTLSAIMSEGSGDPWTKIQADIMAYDPQTTPDELNKIRSALAILRGQDF